jgi:pyridoxine 5-phosphate synthase
MVAGAAETGAERIEFYTGRYAHEFGNARDKAIAPHREAASRAESLGIGINAGHDLNLHNLAFYRQQIPSLLEVSIGHALIADALYYGLQNTIGMYLRQLARQPDGPAQERLRGI